MSIPSTKPAGHGILVMHGHKGGNIVHICIYLQVTVHSYYNVI